MSHNSKKNTIPTPLSGPLSTTSQESFPSQESLSAPVPAGNIPKLDTLPLSAYQVIDLYTPSFDSELKIPLYESLIPGGFPSPADDFTDRKVTLDELYVTNRHATFLIRVKGDSMQGCGILDKAMLVVDKSRQARHGSVVLAVIYGEFTCKRLHIENQRIYLYPENPAYKPLLITEQMDFRVWGVVKTAIIDIESNTA